MRQLWWRVRGALLVASANFLIAATVALVAALLSLIVEDLIPATGERHLSRERMLALVVSLVALFAALLCRGRVHQRTGTLFYVRILDDTMPDRHTAALMAARHRRMSLRSVARWIDLAAHTTPGGMIDVVADCRQVASALEATINEDRDDTAYSLAPNMLWPMALAIGAQLPIVERLHLLELGPTELRFVLPSASTPHPHKLIIHREANQDSTCPDGRVGLLLAFSKAATGMPPERVFAAHAVSEHYLIRPAHVGADPTQPASRDLDSQQLAALAACLPTAMAEIKNRAGERELVVAAAMPKTLAVAVGWLLAQSQCRFFTNTHLLHYDSAAKEYQPIRVHPAQPTHPPAGGG